MGSDPHCPARPRVRARIHLSEPGRRGSGALPLHAWPVLDAVLHVDRRRASLDPAAVARAQPIAQPAGRRRDAARAALREVRRHVRRLDPDCPLRRAPGVVQELAVLRPPGGRTLPRRGRPRRRHAGGTAAALLAARPRRAVLGRGRPGVADGHRRGPERDPVVVYSSLVGSSDTYFYGRWDGRHWRTRPIASAGRRCSPTTTPVSRSTTRTRRGSCSAARSRAEEIEARHTPDHGRSWCRVQLTHRSSTFNIRPVIPRGLSDPRRLVVLYVSGSARSFREFDTDIVMASGQRAIPPRGTGESAIQPIWGCWSPGRSSRVAGSRRRLAAAEWASFTGHVRSI